MNEAQIIQLVKEDDWMMNVLRTFRDLRLPDWMIGAGFIRSKVWDHLHGYTERTPIPDLDTLHFDRINVSEEKEKEYEQALSQKIGGIEWSVKNGARMHIVNNEPPYTSSADWLAHWVETATAVAVSLDEKENPVIVAPYGIHDLVNLIVRPCPKFTRGLEMYRKRVQKKQWLEKWPKLKAYDL